MFVIGQPTRTVVERLDSENKSPSLLNLHPDSDCEVGQDGRALVSFAYVTALSFFFLSRLLFV